MLIPARFTSLCLSGIGASLEIGQAEKQHGLRPNRRLEQYLLTAHMFPDKATQPQIPICIVSLDLFEGAHWPALCEALRAHGISDHLTWILHKFYEAQLSYSKQFPNRARVGQGRVLSPRLLYVVHQARSNGRVACDGFWRQWF